MINPKEVTNELRNKAKKIFYSVLYGEGVNSLARELSVSKTSAIDITNFFNFQYPKLKAFSQKCLIQCKEKGFVTTLMGRRRYFPSLSTSPTGSNQTSLGISRNEEEALKRQVVNTVCQGSAADILKLSLIKIESELGKFLEDPNEAKLAMLVHDEVIYEVKDDLVEKVIKIVKDSMESCADLSVPLRVSVKTGKKWGSLIKAEDN